MLNIRLLFLKYSNRYINAVYKVLISVMGYKCGT